MNMKEFSLGYNPAIYSASKIWHNTKWTTLRDVEGYNIISRWIDIPCGSEGDPTGAKLLTSAEKAVLWTECAEDVRKCDITILYGEKEEQQRGGIAELGMAIMANKPVYIIGSCPSFEPVNHSDAAYMHHPLVKRIHTTKFGSGMYDYSTGYAEAVNHYRNTYHTPERYFRNTGFLNAPTPTSLTRLHQKAIAA